MSENVGEIVYIIRADTAQLLSAGRNVVDMTNDLQSNFDDADESADNLNTTLSKLAATLKLIFAAGALREMAKMVQSYQEMAERVQMATSSQEEFEHVQKRLLSTANGTYRSLSEAQELYIRSADGLRSMGYATDQAIDVQDSMSYAFVKNAASADRAESAISAFTKAINTGKVSADQWESITTAIPTVINDIASASGKTAAEVRALGAAGKLTASELSEGLRQSLDENAAAAAGMSNNLTDAGVRMKTAFTEVLVAIEGQTGALQTFTNGLISAADTILEFGRDSESMAGFIDTATIAAQAFALVLAGKYAGALKIGIASKVQNIAANRQMITSENQAAQAALFSANATQRRSLADKEAAISALNLAQAEYNVARGSAAEMLALDNLIAAKTRATTASIALAEAETAQAAATLRASAAASAASVGMGLMRGALSFLGGPTGVVMIAAAALLYWWQSARQAKEESINFADRLDDIIARMKEMSQIQLKEALNKTTDSVRNQKDALMKMYDSLEDARKKVAELERQLQGLKDSGAPAYVIAEAQERLTEALSDLSGKAADTEQASQKLSETQRKLIDIQVQLNQKIHDSESAFETLYDNLNNKIPNANKAAVAAMTITIQTLDKLNKKAANVGNIQPAEPEDSPEAKKLIQNAERRLALSKLEGEARARLQAQYDADDANLTDEKKRRALEDQYAETERLTSARKAANKEAKKSADDATQFLSRQQSALDRLNTGYADGSLELAKYDAVMALGNKATDAQIVKAEQQADAIWRSQQAIKAAAEEEKKRTQASQNFTSLQGQVSPVAAVDNSYLTQMAQLNEYVTLYPQKIAEAEALRASIEEQYHQRRMAAMWEEWQQQSQINNMIGAAVDSLQGGATSAITGLINGTQSLRESFANIGTTILNSVVGSFVQMGIEWAKSQLMGQAAAAASLAATTAQASAAAAAWAPAAMSASIATYGSAAAVGQSAYAGSMLMAKGMALAGGRRYGGTVSAGNAYRINEDGRSEVFQTAGGQQIFMPNKSGKIIPADKAGGGGVVQHITFEINTTGGIDQATMKQMEGMMKRVALFQINDQANRPNGMIQPRTKR